MREQEEIQQNMENALKSRREEVEQLNQGTFFLIFLCFVFKILMK